MRLASVRWDTRTIGPKNGGGPRRWFIYVTLDPRDEIEEVHELLDRYDDPLINGSGVPLDRFERGQNNTGWTMVPIAPARDESERLPSTAATDIWMPADCLRVLRADGSTASGTVEVPQGKRVRLRASIGSAWDDYGSRRLRIFVTAPDGHREMLASCRV